MTISIDLEYNILPGQTQTMHEPGFEPEVEITSCKIGKRNVDIRDQRFWEALSEYLMKLEKEGDGV